MRDTLLNLISRTIELLKDCGWQDKASWFEEIRTVFETKSTETDVFQQKLNELDRILAGMGSFSDLSLASKSGKLSDQEVRRIQWELVEEIGDAINELSKIKDEKRWIKIKEGK